jgi:hypothetical protein
MRNLRLIRINSSSGSTVPTLAQSIAVIIKLWPYTDATNVLLAIRETVKVQGQKVMVLDGLIPEELR